MILNHEVEGSTPSLRSTKDQTGQVINNAMFDIDDVIMEKLRSLTGKYIHKIEILYLNTPIHLEIDRAIWGGVDSSFEM